MKKIGLDQSKWIDGLGWAFTEQGPFYFLWLFSLKNEFYSSLYFSGLAPVYCNVLGDKCFRGDYMYSIHVMGNYH